MLLFAIDRTSSTPVYRQIAVRVARLVDDGTLAPGTRLPPTRRLAESLAVHRSTAIAAYRELTALGYLESRPGSYSTIRRRLRPPGARPGPAGPAAVLRPPAVSPHPADGAPGAGAPGVIDFARHTPDPALAPHDFLRRCVKRALAGAARAGLTDYADPRGLIGLREAISERMAAHGVAAAADEILVTNGTQHALDLVFRLLLRPGAAALVEEPTYGMALALLRLHRARPAPIPMREDGLDLEQLERRLARRRPALLYTMPNFQNPTGITTSPTHRERLLAHCERHRVPIVEDGFDEELTYAGPAVLPLKSIDARGLVLYLGTLSKVMFPGLRIGWIVAPREMVSRLAAMVRATTLSGSTLAQAAAARLLAGAELETYLRRAHGVLRRRRAAMLAALEEHLPGRVRWTRPEGGYTLWLTLPGAAAREAALVERIARAGVRVAAGREFLARPAAAAHLRLSFACVGEPEIAEGCRRLGAALR